MTNIADSSSANYMKVILTEKPSVARDIAKCLNIADKRDGYFEGNGYQIAWAFGHLVELKEPDEYDKALKRWSLETLPIIPEQFGLKARGDAQAQKQLNTIKRLFKAADEIICATDAGREGELIFRYILTWSRCLQKPFKRLWISSLTDEAIRKGFAELRNGHAYDGLYHAAKCRSEADWIVGINATRLYTLKFGQNGGLWSIGRVQTPVLALIVQRDLDIRDFIPKDFWELRTRYRDIDFQYTGGRFDSSANAEALFNRIQGTEFRITGIKGKQESIGPPLLYDLTDLQKDMSIRHGLTADQTLNAAQQLYEKKHVTYPRTDSRCLTNDMKQDIRPLLEKLRVNYPAPIEALDLERLTLGSRMFNDAKVTDHHAIIPTTALPGSLSHTEAIVYDAIVLRFIAGFYPPCLKNITTVHGCAETETVKVEFKTTGAVIESQGWQALYKNEPSSQDKEQRILPNFVEGEVGPHQPSITQGKTSPPKPYNEASLLSMMESAGKTCDDEQLKEALKEKGLGTPATRASIIEVLIKRNYIQRQKKNLLSTESGRHLISIIDDDRLKSAAMTGEWEAKLKRIEQNDYGPEQFMAEIIRFTHGIKEQSLQPLYDNSRLGDCPKCGKPIIEGRKGYGCSDWKAGCRFVLWKESYGVSIDHAMASQLLQTGRGLQRIAIQDNDRSLTARLTLNAQGEIGYVETESKPRTEHQAAIANCPLCHGQIIETPKAFSCTEWRNGCKMAIWKTIANKKITVTMAKKLLDSGETGMLKGFKSSKGKEFEARLKLVNGKVEMDFSASPHSMPDE